MLSQYAHAWLKKPPVCYVPGPGGPLAAESALALARQLGPGSAVGPGCPVDAAPTPRTQVILTTAGLEEPLDWRDALMFTARRKFRLGHVPTVFTIIHATPEQVEDLLRRIRPVLTGENPTPDFPGVQPGAFQTLLQQGRRGGELMYLLRVLQVQAKCVRILLVIGEGEVESAYLFDLVGAHPLIRGADRDALLRDIAIRVLTAASTTEVTNHLAVPPRVPAGEWAASTAVQAMIRASREFGRRDFFTEMIRIADLVHIPGFNEAISSQYSEGCFATWDSRLNGLVATITGSARPVQKEHISDADLALIVGVKPEGDGALVRKVEDHPGHPPSSEAFEMVNMDLPLPQIALPGGGKAPVLRSKLHGHRGVAAYDPRLVEYVPLPENYLHYPVSCSTDAQAWAVQEAFGRSQAARDPLDPRQIIFTILPGHGLIIAEKWAEGKAAFQAIWEAMDSGALEVASQIPQGVFHYERVGDKAVAVFKNKL